MVCSLYSTFYRSGLRRGELQRQCLMTCDVAFRLFSRLAVCISPSMGTLKPQSNGPLYSNTVIGTLAVDGWAVTFGTARRGLGGLGPRPVPSLLYQM